jgi:Xaa-Pro aminopeptidase
MSLEPEHQGRLRKLRELLAAQNLEGLLVTQREDVAYLSGFSGSSGSLLVTRGLALLVTDFRYQLQAQQEAPGFAFVFTRPPKLLADGLLEAISRAEVSSLGFSPAHLSVQQHDQLSSRAPRLRLLPTSDGVGRLRSCKEESELVRIREAAKLADAAFEVALSRLRPGLAERELALELEFFLRREGAEEVPFPPIVASGPRSALPHARPTGREIEAGDLVIIDLGARVDGYCSDLTRTVAVERPSERAKEIYALTHEAQRAGKEALVAGAKAGDVDQAARAVIEAAGYGECFGHGLGHGVGREVHESPRLAKEEAALLEAGMVVTVEPGVYLPEEGGVRLEDLMLVLEGEGEQISSAPNPAALPII